MDKTILCPIDFSDSSLQALECAIDLAHAEKCSVTVIYSFRLITSEEGQEIHDFKKYKEEEARKKFMKLEDFFSKEDEIGYRFIVEIGFVEDSINNQLKKNRVSKLVIDRSMCQSSERENGIPEKFLETLKIPVIRVPEKAEML